MISGDNIKQLSQIKKISNTDFINKNSSKETKNKSLSFFQEINMEHENSSDCTSTIFPDAHRIALTVAIKNNDLHEFKKLFGNGSKIATDSKLFFGAEFSSNVEDNCDFSIRIKCGGKARTQIQIYTQGCLMLVLSLNHTGKILEFLLSLHAPDCDKNEFLEEHGIVTALTFNFEGPENVNKGDILTTVLEKLSIRKEEKYLIGWLKAYLRLAVCHNEVNLIRCILHKSILQNKDYIEHFVLALQEGKFNIAILIAPKVVNKTTLPQIGRRLAESMKLTDWLIIFVATIAFTMILARIFNGVYFYLQ